MNFLHFLLPAIEHLYILGYWIAFFVALLETTVGIGLFIPGSSVILFMGAMAANGYFDLEYLICFAIIGAILGDNINYYIGKKYGSKMFSKGFWFIKPKHLKKGEKFFQKHGPKSVLIGRFIPTVKEVMPLVAGTFKMKRIPFMIWNMFGAIGWSLLYILPGYFFAQSLDIVKIWLTRTGFFLLILLIIFILFYILKVIIIRRGKNLFAFIWSVWKSIKEAIAENKEVQNFVKKHSLFFKFIEKRLDRNSFFGWPLSLLASTLFFTLFLLLGVVEDVFKIDPIMLADINIAHLLLLFRNSGLTNFFLFVTVLGKSYIVFVFILLTVTILWIYHRKEYIFPLFLSVVGSETFAFLGKIFFQRQRPEVALYAEKSFSFPSGHATIAVAFYGFLTYILIRNFGKWKTKVNIFFGGLLIIFLIGFSRLYLGVHYFSDVWGGYLIGASWLIISISISEWLHSKNKYGDSYSSLKVKYISIILILLSLLFYGFFAFNYHPKIIKAETQNQILIKNIDEIFVDGKNKYTKTLTGINQEPISFIIFADNDQSFVDTFIQAGWHLADNPDMHSILKITKAALLKHEYLQAPMTPYFWNEKTHDFGFEKPTALNNVRQRHHARFWKTNYLSTDGKRIYVGIASLDIGMKWGITHRINPDIDSEREFLFKDLKNSGNLKDYSLEEFVKPFLGKNFTGDQFFTDGKIYILNK